MEVNMENTQQFLKEEHISFLLEEKLDILTEEQIAFLIENRIDFIKTANKDKISTDHDPESAKLSSDKIVDHIASKIDPTKNKSHTQWLVNRYKAGDFKLSDHKEVKKVANSYEESKNHLENKDLNSYKSISHLKDSLAPVQAKVAADKEKASDDKAAANDMPVVFNEDGHVGYKIPSKAASIKNYGPAGKLEQTRWCTAANSSNNMFNGYKGGKYTLHLNNGHVLQLHHQSGQMMNKEDHPVDLHKDSRFAPHAEAITKFIKVTHELEGKPDSKLRGADPATHQEVEDAIAKHDSEVAKVKERSDKDGYIRSWGNEHFNAAKSDLINVVSKAHLSDEQFSKLKSLDTIQGNYDPKLTTEDIAKVNLDSPHANPKHITEIVKGVEAPDHKYHEGFAQLQKAYKNPSANAESHHAVIDKILSSEEGARNELAKGFAQHAVGALPEHFTRLEHLPAVKSYTLHNSTSTIPSSYLEDHSDDDSSTVAAHPKIPAHVAEKLINSTDAHTQRALAENHNVPAHISFLAAPKAKGVDLKKVIEHPGMKPDDISSLVSQHMDGKINSNNSWMTSTRISKELLGHVLNHPDVMSKVEKYGTSITDSPKIKSSDLEALVDNPKFDIKNLAHVGGILKSHALKSSVVDKIVAKANGDKNVLASLHDIPHEHITANHLHAMLDSSELGMHDKHKALFHPSTQLSHFNKVKDDVRFHGAISNSKNAPPSILHHLATSPMDHVRLNVANNPNTEKRTHDILKNDSNEEVAKVSAKKAK